MRFNKSSCVTQIDPRVRLGDLQSAKNLSHSITHVISVMSEKPSLHPNGSERKHLFICAEDNEKEDLLLKFGTCYDFITKALEKNDTNQVLIHCRAGKSRSPTIAMMYLMRTYRYDYYTAKKYLKEKRPIISINSGFKKQLHLFYDLLKNYNSKLYSSYFDYRKIFGTKQVKKPVKSERKLMRSSSYDSPLTTRLPIEVQSLQPILVPMENLRIFEQRFTPIAVPSPYINVFV